jgi:cyclic dehypoxanthinyl futalosine synthase
VNSAPVLNHPETLLEKAASGTRLSIEEGAELFSADLPGLGRAATLARDRLHPLGRITFVVDRNISLTNVCVIDCGFCAFHKKISEAGTYTLSYDQVLQKVDELAQAGGTQVLIQGGVNPDLRLDFYLNLVRRIKTQFPQIFIHSFSAVELVCLARSEGLKLREVLVSFKEAGLNSIPGGGAEILVERVRKMISPGKLSADEWIDSMRMAHKVGFQTTATMVFGHIETIEERLIHLSRIRSLQDETKGFRAFIPWTLSPQGTPRMSEFNISGGVDYLKTVAVSRLFLDNIPHIQAGWLTEGLKLGQTALAFGADDAGGTLMEDKVLEPTGIYTKTRREDLVRLIKEAGYVPAERNTNYEMVKVFN